jgi:hypothetical protein
MSSIIPSLPPEIKNEDEDIKEEKKVVIDENFVEEKEIETEEKPKKKRTRKMTPAALEALKKARESSLKTRIERAQNKKNQSVEEVIEEKKEDSKYDYLETKLKDYENLFNSISDKNNQLEQQILNMQQASKQQEQPKRQHYYQPNNNPYEQTYTFEEMEYYANERHKQLLEKREKQESLKKKDDIQVLRDRYLYNMR